MPPADHHGDASIPWRAAFPALAEPAQPGRMLRAARTREGLTQAQVATMTGIPQSQISAIERGTRPITRAQALALVKALQIDGRLLLAALHVPEA
jgi:transcriptional regulator with XRE-family HTH domain